MIAQKSALFETTNTIVGVNSHLLFNGQRVRAWDGQFVEEHEELAERLEEGPARQHTDALVGVDGSIGDHFLLHCSEQTQLDLLLLI